MVRARQILGIAGALAAAWSPTSRSEPAGEWHEVSHSTTSAPILASLLSAHLAPSASGLSSATAQPSRWRCSSMFTARRSLTRRSVRWGAARCRRSPSRRSRTTRTLGSLLKVRVKSA